MSPLPPWESRGEENTMVWPHYIWESRGGENAMVWPHYLWESKGLVEIFLVCDQR